jgi:endoglucanase
VTNGQFCVMLQQLSSVTIGYPSGGVPPFQITGGASYTFSYQASSTGNLSVESKVGQTQAPYDATGSDFMNESVNGSLSTITHTFTRGSTDSSMGIAFNVAGGPGTFCIDNVSLTAN